MSSPSERIKAAVSVPALLEREGLRPGRNGFLRCPLHPEDRSPSFKVYPDGESWYCFGCQRGGDVIALAMALYGVDFRGAVRRLAGDFGLPLAQSPCRSGAARQAALDRWKGRRKREEAELEHRLDEAEWAQCNRFIHEWPYFLNPWPWLWAKARRDALGYRLECYEQGERGGEGTWT